MTSRNATAQMTTTTPPSLFISSDFSFDSLQEDLEELRADDKVRGALDSGADLSAYADQVEKELKALVQDSIPDFVREAPETTALHEDIEACDAVLANIEQILLEFQKDLGGISEEIRHLQEGSMEMGIKLKNRRAVELRFRAFLEQLTVPEALVKAVCDDDVVKVEYVETLKRLEEHMAFAREQQEGLPLRRGGGGAGSLSNTGSSSSNLLANAAANLPTAPAGGANAPRSRTASNADPDASAAGSALTDAVVLPIAPCNAAATQDIEPLLEKLRLRATAKARAFFTERINSLRKPSTNCLLYTSDAADD